MSRLAVGNSSTCDYGKEAFRVVFPLVGREQVVDVLDERRKWHCCRRSYDCWVEDVGLLVE